MVRDAGAAVTPGMRSPASSAARRRPARRLSVLSWFCRRRARTVWARRAAHRWHSAV